MGLLKSHRIIWSQIDTYPGPIMVTCKKIQNGELITFLVCSSIACTDLYSCTFNGSDTMATIRYVAVHTRLMILHYLPVRVFPSLPNGLHPAGFGSLARMDRMHRSHMSTCF